MGHVRLPVLLPALRPRGGAGAGADDPASPVPTIGASGAITGVLAAYIVLFPHGRIRTLVILGLFGLGGLVPAWVHDRVSGSCSSSSGRRLARGADEGGGVAFWAHVGGFMAGVVLVWVFKDQSAVDRQCSVRARNQSWKGPRWAYR